MAPHSESNPPSQRGRRTAPAPQKGPQNEGLPRRRISSSLAPVPNLGNSERLQVENDPRLRANDGALATNKKPTGQISIHHLNLNFPWIPMKEHPKNHCRALNDPTAFVRGVYLALSFFLLFFSALRAPCGGSRSCASGGQGLRQARPWTFSRCE